MPYPLLLETTIPVDGVPVAVTVHDWGAFPNGETLYHFEFQSIAEPPRPIPVSHTGYRSQFVYQGEIEHFDSLEEAAAAIADYLLGEERKGQESDRDQPSLFDTL